MLQKELGYEFQNILYNDLCGKLTVCYLYVLDSHTTPGHPGYTYPMLRYVLLCIYVIYVYIIELCVGEVKGKSAL